MHPRHRRLGDAFQGSDEFVAPFEQSTIVGGDYLVTPSEAPIDTSTAQISGDIPLQAVPVDTSSATVSVQELQQQQQQGMFANPQVPPAYDLSYQQRVAETQQANMYSNIPLLAAQVNALKAFGMWSGGVSPMEAAAAAGAFPITSSTLAPATQPGAVTSSPATATAPAASSWVSSLLSWLQSPVSQSISIPWYMAIVAGAAALYLLKDE